MGSYRKRAGEPALAAIEEYSMRAKLLLTVGVLISVILFGADVRLSPRFHTVFILRMANGQDQYLANRLTRGGVLGVVLEPTKADAVLTENVDDGFWAWLARTYPSSTGSASQSSGHDAPVGRWILQPSKHRGTVFLVDPRNRRVAWSTYVNGKDNTPDELDRAAARVASQLKASLNQK